MTQIIDDDYKKWIVEIKSKIRSAQMKAALSVNAALIEFYWYLGKMISEKQTTWGSNFLEKVSNDLQSEFPEMKGFSVTNLKYCRLFYNQFSISPQVGDESLFELLKQIPWGHTKLIINKIKDNTVAKFYIQKTLENAWGREILALQIKSRLYERQGKAVTNFKLTLPAPMSDLAQQTLKDPYNFDFVAMTDSMKERDLENQLVSQISKFLLELGKGFAFVGRQYKLEIADNEYYLDLLFYHIKLKCYVVVELKIPNSFPNMQVKSTFIFRRWIHF